MGQPPRAYDKRGLRAWVLGLLLIVATGCDFPRDTAGTLARVTGGTMRVGVSDHEPWSVTGPDGAGGVEVALVREWARQLDAQVEWVSGAEADLVEALRHGELDLVLAGFTDDSPWRSRVAFTQPYITITALIGVPPGQPASADWEGQAVAVDRRRPLFAALVREIGARPVPPEPAAARPAALFGFELEARGLRPSDEVLKEERHVMAAAPGESAFLLALDRFLQAREGEVRRRLAREAAR